MAVSGEEVAKSWYDEINKYDFNNPGFSAGTGHFTQVTCSYAYLRALCATISRFEQSHCLPSSVQVVWAGTTHMGAGSAVQGNAVFVVANYTPPGNVIGRQNFMDNVKRPK